MFSAEDIGQAKQKAGESLKGTYDQVSRSSLTVQQLKHVTKTTWAIQARSSKGATSLAARLVDTNFKQQLLGLDIAPCASSPSHLSLKILLTLSLINRWDVITTNISSASIQATKANDELVLVQPPPELQQDPDVLWKLTKALYGIQADHKLWQLIVGDKHQQESFLSQLSASITSHRHHQA